MHALATDHEATAGGTRLPYTILQYYLLSALVEGLISLYFLLRTPSEPKSAWLWGFSRSRLALAAILIFFLLLFLWGSLKSFRERSWLQTIAERIEALTQQYGLFPAFWVAAFAWVVLSPYLLLLLQVPPLPFLLPASPLIFFALTRALQTLLLLLVFFFSANRAKAAPAHKDTLFLPPKYIALALAAIIVLLLVGGLSALLLIHLAPLEPASLRYLDKFNLLVEQNVPTYFSSLLLSFSALLLGVIAVMKRHARAAYSLHWTLLPLIFLLLSLDETAGLHESVMGRLRLFFNTEGIFFYAWVIPAIPMVILFALAYSRFLLHLPRKSKRLFALSGLLYVAGALGLEMLAGGLRGTALQSNALLFDSVPFAEESLEMLGIALFVYTLLDYLSTDLGTVTLRFSTSPGGADGRAIKLSPKGVSLVLGLLVLLLVLASIAGDIVTFTSNDPAIYGPANLNLALERNLPTHFSILILALCALLLGLIARGKIIGREAYVWHWAFLALIFLFLSIDETAGFHELLNKPLGALFETSGVFYFAWLVLGIPLTFLLALLYLGFLNHLPRPSKNRFVFAALLYVGGALGFELLAGWQASTFGENLPAYALITTVAETLEMGAIVLFIYALLEYLASYAPDIELRFSNPAMDAE